MKKQRRKNDNMELKSYIKPVTNQVMFIEIDGKEFNFFNLMNVLEELSDTSYGFSFVLIDDQALGEVLVNEKIAYKSIKGSYTKGTEYDQKSADIEKLYYTKLEEFQEQLNG